jgi:hypothetical protein
MSYNYKVISSHMEDPVYPTGTMLHRHKQGNQNAQPVQCCIVTYKGPSMPYRYNATSSPIDSPECPTTTMLYRHLRDPSSLPVQCCIVT